MTVGKSEKTSDDAASATPATAAPHEAEANQSQEGGETLETSSREDGLPADGQDAAGSDAENGSAVDAGEEGEEEMEFAPRIDFEDTDGFDEDFREEYKSFDEVENSWQSILKVGGSAAVGMTSNSGFTPAVHNITYGDCGCQKKKSKCGCDD